MESELDQKNICLDCVGEDYLKEFIQSKNSSKKCSYCEENNFSVYINEIALLFKSALEDHFWQTSDEPSYEESRLAYEFGDEWYRKGEEIECIFQDIGEIQPEPASDIRSYLEENYNCPRSYKDPYEEPPYCEEAHYNSKSVDDIEYCEEWSRLEEYIKTNNRFFGIEQTLEKIFDLSNYKEFHKELIIEAGPREKIEYVYRARVFQSDSMLEKALSNPHLEIGPPPFKESVESRMSAKGVSAFYGAFDVKTAIAEVRPPVGSNVVVGRFAIEKENRFLNLRAFKGLSQKVDGSIFDKEYLAKLQHLTFLERLCDIISRPVMPSDESFEYLITQSISDFIAYSKKLDLDGIIYPSVYSGQEKDNVVIFYKSSRMKNPLRHNSKIFVNSMSHDEDGSEIDYHVFEEYSTDSSTDEMYELPDKSIKSWFLYGQDDDVRALSLAIDINSLQVHHINKVSIDSTKHDVTWTKHETRSDEKTEF